MIRRSTIPRIRPYLLGALLVAVCLALLVAGTRPARAAAEPPRLPAPTGRYPVGMTPMHLVDEDRADPWKPEVRRELMVSLWYPAVPNGRHSPYIGAKASAAYIADVGLPVEPDILSRVETHAYDRAIALPGRRPLVVLSPGGGLPRASLSSLAEELASRGYVVAGIDHPYEATAVELPGGRLAGCLVCELDFSRELGAKVSQGRAKDAGFVLDRLTGGRLWPGAPMIDKNRVGMGGHSLGGASSATTMLTDSRVDAGVNLDGTFFEPVPTRGVDRPFLMMGGKPHEPGTEDETWEQTWSQLTGPRRWLQVPTADHMSFSDWMLLGEQLGVPPQPDTIGGVRGMQITRAYVAAFFDRHLRGRDAPLLDAPSPTYPEVTFRG
ncbi:MAG: alpha/beta hydrolase [Streptosporangiales bacterium]|nr:alpha/beta hydrolase [Streptosporangiales bacterium]